MILFHYLKTRFLCTPTENEAEKDDDPEEWAENDDSDGEHDHPFETEGRNLDRNLLFACLPNVTS